MGKDHIQWLNSQSFKLDICKKKNKRGLNNSFFTSPLNGKGADQVNQSVIVQPFTMSSAMATGKKTTRQLRSDFFMSTLSGLSAANLKPSSSKKGIRSSSRESLQASLQAIRFNQEHDQVSLLSPTKSQHNSFASRAEQLVKAAESDAGFEQVQVSI